MAATWASLSLKVSVSDAGGTGDKDECFLEDMEKKKKEEGRRRKRVGLVRNLRL